MQAVAVREPAPPIKEVVLTLSYEEAVMLKEFIGSVYGGMTGNFGVAHLQSYQDSNYRGRIRSSLINQLHDELSELGI